MCMYSSFGYIGLYFSTMAAPEQSMILIKDEPRRNQTRGQDTHFHAEFVWQTMLKILQIMNKLSAV